MRYIIHKAQQLKFLSGLDPIIESRPDFGKFIPNPYHTVICISADFELAWAGRFSKKKEPLQNAIVNAKRERENLPIILNVLDRYQIPVTWLTVGHLFLEGCRCVNGKPHPQLPRIAHFENRYWKFDETDWFIHDPCSDYKQAPEWYCPDLIKQIIESPVKHEIGCHTFSHLDCRDEVCSPDIFLAELLECKRIAKAWDIELKSFVHPAHTIGNLDSLASAGFTNFRTDYNNTLGYPIKHNNGLWEFKQTMEFRYYSYWNIQYQINRYISIIKRSIKSKTHCVFWFHPSMDLIFIEKIWPKVFDFIDQNRDKIWITTHSEYIKTISNEI